MASKAVVQTEGKTEFNTDKTKISSGNSIVINFNTNEAKAGDIYKVIIPETTADGFDATNSDGQGIDKVTAGQFQGNYGNSVTTYDKDKKQWVITDTFTKANANSQPILVNTNSNFSADKLHSTGTFTRQAFLYKNDELLKTIEFEQTIAKNIYLSWDTYTTGSSDASHALYTLSGKEVNPGVGDDLPLKANTDYEWRLNVNNFGENFNHGTTLEVPMPANFVLNTEATNAANSNIISDYHGVFTQDGQKIRLVLPKLTQNIPNSGYSMGINLIGQFKMDTPKGNTTLSTSDRPTVTQKTNDTTGVATKSITPVTVTILVQDHGLDDLPAGSVFTASIAPDKYDYDQITGEIDKTKPITAIEDKTNHNLNNNIGVRNITAYDLNNVSMTVNVPDGMDISGLSTPSDNRAYKYVFTLDDGTTQSGSVAANSVSTVIPAITGKKIKSVKLTFDKVKAFDSINGFGLNGVLAKKYSDGSEVKAGNNLHTDLYVIADGIKDAKNPAHFTQNEVIIEKAPVKPEIHYNQINAMGRQTNDQPGAKEAGYIDLYSYDLLKKPEKLTYYVVLPTNANLNSSKPMYGDAVGEVTSLTQFKTNGRTIVKITGDFVQKATANSHDVYLKLDNSNLITKLNLTSDYQVYVSLPQGEKLRYNSSRVTDNQVLPFVENSTNAYRLTSGNWNVIAATGTYSTSLAQGNKNTNLIPNGQSDDKGSWNMTFSNVLVNSEDKDTYHAVIVSHVPGTDDGKSEFNFQLTGDNSAQVVNLNTGDAITSGVQNYYSIDNLNINSLNRDDPDLMSHFVTADKVTDWSKIKTVLTTIGKIPGNTVYGVSLNGYDPTFAKDVNKTAYASSAAWTDDLNPVTIAAGDKGSAAINISGQSTIKFKLHFEDGSQVDISVPTMNHTYKDGIDTVKQSDFISATKNSDFDDAVNKKNYTLIPEAIINAIPDGYVLDIESGYKIENSDTKYPNNMSNGTAAFGKTSMYDFDGDTVVYNLVKKRDFVRNIVVKRHVEFVDERNQTNKLQKDYDLETPLTLTINGSYNPLTGAVDQIDFDALFKNLNLENYQVPANIGTFLRDGNNGQDYYGVPNSVFKDGVGSRLPDDLKENRNTGVVYDIKSGGLSLNTDKKVADNTIEFDQNLTFYYVPSRANLILMGQGLGEKNQLLDTSNSVDENYHENSNIVFKFDDQTLARSGYTYKVYYFDGQDLQTLVQSANTSFILTEKENTIDYVTQSQLLDMLTVNGEGEKYDTLLDALKAHPKYDTMVDNDDLKINGNTQNFFVVYTPVENRKQTLYILSDNDPYTENATTKTYALPKTTEEADESGTDYFKVQGETGNSLIKPTTNGSQTYNAFDPYNSWQNGQYETDKDGNQVHHHPSLPENDPLGLGMLSIYKRAGYYIDKATYQVTDKEGKLHTVVITNKLNKDKFVSNNSDSVNSAMLNLLTYLTTGKLSSGSSLNLSENGMSKDDSSFVVSITGLSGAKTYTDDTGTLNLELPADATWSFDNTDYDNKDDKNIDLHPQIIKLSYAAYPIDQNSTPVNVKIHYIDVDQIPPLTQEAIDSFKESGTILAPATSKYSAMYNSGTELELNSDGTEMIEGSDNPVTIEINKADQIYDNTAKDDQILALLKKQGYIVVQRDKQTRGEQQYDPYSSDASNGSYDGNYGSYDGNYIPSEQNYYVFVKKAHKINYQVVVEDENGNVESKKLVDPTELGEGTTDDDIATALVNPDEGHSQTFAQKYQNIIDSISSNYTVVPHASTDAKLKKTDILDGLKFEGDPQLVTIYVTHKKGNVTIHYIDVDGSDKTNDFEPADGAEITDPEQSFENQNYGDTYSNTPWDYTSDNYVLATTSLPDGVTSGIVDKPNTDIYVYLKHKKTVITETTTLHENIKYQYENGNQAKPDYDHSIEYTRENIKDNHTGNTTYREWKPGKDQKATAFEDVTSPTIGGYTADKAEVAAPIPADNDFVNGKTHNYNYVVKYTADGQKITVNYIDDTTGKTLATKELTGKSDENSNYATNDSISSYKEQHYDLVFDETGGKELVFDHDDKKDQVYNVHLTHHMTPINDSKTINETIHYVYEDGTKAYKDTKGIPVTFTRDGQHDEVTDKDNWNDWKSEKNSFDEVRSPEIAGYTPDQAKIGKITVDHDSKDIEKTVTYKIDNQKAQLRFYDDTDGKFIELAPDINVNGDSDSKLNFDIPSSYNFTNYNFVAVAKGNDPKDSSDKLNGKKLSGVDYGKFDKDKNKDQVFIAHFTHKTEPINNTKVVNETIHYVYEDGTPAHEDVNKQVKFTETGIRDLVNSKNTKIEWTKSQDFDEVKSPAIAGYTPDQDKIDKITVNHDSNDIEITVTYHRDVVPEGPIDKQSIPDQHNKSEKPVVPDKADKSDNPTKKEKIVEHKTAKHHKIEKHAVHNSSKSGKSKTSKTKKNYYESISGVKGNALEKGQRVRNRDSNSLNTPKGLSSSSKVTDVKVRNNTTNSVERGKLPQTGENDNHLGLIGLILSCEATLFGIADYKRKREK